MKSLSQDFDSLYGVILAGGKGERFWPLSRKGQPKQLLPILGDSPLIKSTFERIRPFIPPHRIFIVAQKDLAPSIDRLVTGWNSRNFLPEPKGMNTAPAVAYAAEALARRDPDGTMVVLPADHHIPNPGRFLETLKVAVQGAQNDLLVTFGIVPTRPETGYGYIEVGEEFNRISAGGKKREIPIHRAKGFKEKPNQKEAREFLKRGDFLWNSGIFVWKIPTILVAIQKHLPKLALSFQKFTSSFGTSREKDTLKRVYNEIDPISIDYGVLERAENVAVIRADFPWDDLGTWSSLPRLKGTDKDGNYIVGEHLGIETHGSTVVSQKGLVATLGVSDLLIVRTQEITLVARKDRDQDVKRVVERLWEEEKFKKYR